MNDALGTPDGGSAIGEDELRLPVGIPQRTQLGVKIIETTSTLEAIPGRIPLLFVTICVGIPMVIWFWELFSMWRQGKAPDAWWVGAFITGCLAPPSVILLIYFVNRFEQRKGKLFVLDMATGVLELPRLNIRVQRADLLEVVELHGWVKYGHFVDVSALARTEDRGTVRYPVAFDTLNRRDIVKAATRLADYYRVPKRVITADRTDRQKQAFRQSLRRFCIGAASLSIGLVVAPGLIHLLPLAGINSATIEMLIGATAILASIIGLCYACWFWRPRCPTCGSRARFRFVAENYEFLSCPQCGYNEPTGGWRRPDPG